MHGERADPLSRAVCDVLLHDQAHSRIDEREVLRDAAQAGTHRLALGSQEIHHSVSAKRQARGGPQRVMQVLGRRMPKGLGEPRRKASIRVEYRFTSQACVGQVRSGVDAECFEIEHDGASGAGHDRECHTAGASAELGERHFPTLSVRRGRGLLQRMQRYVAFLRGVSPMNAKMSELVRAFEKAGFKDVKTVLGTGNVVFSTRDGTDAAIALLTEQAMQKHLARPFPSIVRSVPYLQKLLTKDPFQEYDLAPGSKRVVTFLRNPAKVRVTLPLSLEGASMLAKRGGEVLSAYIPSPGDPVFMRLIEKTLGKDVTTRTWETVIKVTK